jgi:beta-apo-4'-carotenal oxygenase
MHLAARRLLWGKNMNAGQVCVSHNYTIIEASALSTFLAEYKIAFDEFYPRGARASPDYARIINLRQFQRLKDMLDATGGRILHGGATDEADLFIEPTLVQVSSLTDSLLTSESFGPLLPILPVPDLDAAIRIANDVSGTPLGIYAFGSKSETSRILNETRSGGATINDSFFHGSIPTLPFGGVGESGQGSYRGRASFECFSHRRSVVATPAWMEGLLGIRYPPYTEGKLRMSKAMYERTPSFDRAGNKTVGLVRYIIGLGGKSTAGAVARWALAVAVVLGLRRMSPMVDREVLKGQGLVSSYGIGAWRTVLGRAADVLEGLALAVRRRA